MNDEINIEILNLFQILGISRNKKKAKELLKLIKTLETKAFWKLNELAIELDLQYKTLYKYISELEIIGIIEKKEFVDGIYVGLKKDFKTILKKKIKEHFNHILNALEEL